MKEYKEKKEILYLNEYERRRIAEDLHDTTVQELVHLSQQLELALMYMDKDIIQSRLEILSAKNNVKKIISGIRETIYDLRPVTLDDIGWETSINRLYNELVENNSGIQVNFDIDDVKVDDKIIEVSLYRIIKEACQNVVKHSRAKNMWVSLRFGDEVIRLIIKDDGDGFQSKEEEKHFGIPFMKERVMLLSGKIDIESNSDGTVIFVEIPRKKH